MSKINEQAVLVIGGVNMANQYVRLREANSDVWLEASTSNTITLSVDAARKLARELYRLARRVEKRLQEPEPAL
jgi:hypothetical protein